MKKIKTNIVAFLPYVFFFVMSLVILTKQPGSSGDEIWNYNFARNIVNGLRPYSDFNMVQTPLSSYIAALFFKCFGDSLFSFRILSILLAVITFSLLYFLTSKIINDKFLPFVATTFIFILNLLVWIYNYNNLMLLFVLLVMLFEFYRNNRKFKKCLTIGIGLLYGLMPLVKQSTGAFLFLLNSLVCFYNLFKNQKKKECLIQFCASILPTVVYLELIKKAGFLDDFIEYAVLGIRNFTHRTTYVSFLFSSPFAFLIGLFPIVVMIYSIYKYYEHSINTKKETHIIFLLISIAASSVIYPLCDPIHIFPALVPYIVCLFSSMKKKEYNVNQKTMCRVFALFIGAVFMITSFLEIANLKMCQLNNFRKLPINSNIEYQIKEVDDYILNAELLGKKVIIADESAALFMIPLDKYNKDFDMLLVGNIGTKTTKDLLKNKQDTVFLVLKDDGKLGTQADFELIYHIKNNFNKIGEVSSFDVYVQNEE